MGNFNVELKTEPAERRFKSLGFCYCVVVPKGARPDIERITSFAVLQDCYAEKEDEALGVEYLVQFGDGGQEKYDDDSLRDALDRFLS